LDSCTRDTSWPKSNPADKQTAVRQGLGEFREGSRKKEGKAESGEKYGGDINFRGARSVSAEGN
jgi:hypothetical protein